ncbi:MAG TPA: hypothetical protein VFG49_05475 [Dyella sp.]|uniref:hypothetical protein n=1 Tax=Dyella sp. TaxID=1869338 RepID=UPI002D774441|nr:hypothetical protein [Dyella sp.]HET6552973.1 hypothetical protein [Dyella sp.]
MNRLLAFGYLLTVMVMAASIAIARGALTHLDGITSFFMSQAICLGLFPASFALFKGARRSSSKLRKSLGYAMSVLDVLLASGATAAVALIVAGNGRFHLA